MNGSKIKFERLPNIPENEHEGDSFHFIKNKNVNKVVTGVYEKKLYDDDISEKASFHDSCNLNNYDGSINLWVNKKELFKFPNSYDVNQIDIFSCLYGYCLVGRSKVFKDFSLKYCRDLSWNKIIDCNMFSKGHLLLGKMPHWEKYLPCTILKINDVIKYGSEKTMEDLDNFGETTFEVIFPCCPDSDIFLAWHNHNSIVKNKSVLSYPKKRFFSDIEELDTVFDCSDEESDASNDVVVSGPVVSGPVVSGPVVSGPVVSGPVVSDPVVSDPVVKDLQFGKNYISEKNVSGMVNKICMGKEILQFHTYWLRDYSYLTRNCSISRKSITVGANEFSNKTSFLPNVCVLENYEIEHILKIQSGCKFFNWPIEYKNAMYNNKLEPQESSFFNFSSDKHVIKKFLNNKKGVTFTGILCESARKYLFNITKFKS